MSGITGFLGSKFARYILSTTGITIKTLIRPKSNLQITHVVQLFKDFGSRIQCYYGNLENDNLVYDRKFENLFTNSKSFWHFAGEVSLKNQCEVTSSRIYQSNVLGTKNVLTALSKYSRENCRFCYISTAYVAGNRAGLIMEEPVEFDTTFNNPYEKSKAEAEALIFKYCRRNFKIFRPSIVVEASHSKSITKVLGPYGLIIACWHLYENGVRTIRLNINQNSNLNLVTIDDVVAKMVSINSNCSKSNMIFHLTGHRNINVSKIANVFIGRTEELGSPVRIEFVRGEGNLSLWEKVLNSKMNEILPYATKKTSVFFDHTNTDRYSNCSVYDEVDVDMLVGLCRNMVLSKDRRMVNNLL